MEESQPMFEMGQRVHSVGDTRRIGTVKYIGPVEGYSGTWVGVDWDNGDGKHDGSVNGVRYFQATLEKSASFVRPQNLSSGITFLEALMVRYQGQTTKEEEDEMYVLSASNKKVSIQLIGKDKIQNKLNHFEELCSASLAYLGVSSAGNPSQISSLVPNLKELDLTGNLIFNWKVELLKDCLPSLEELHLMGNKISEITPASNFVQGFSSLRILNLDENCISDWSEVLKLSTLTSLEQLHLSKNNISQVFYPLTESNNEASSNGAFQNLHCLLLGANNIVDLASVDSLNSFPRLTDVRLSENPIADPGRGGIPRFVLIARLKKVEVFNGSEVSCRERKESEIRYVRLVMAKLHENRVEIKRQHPRFYELKSLHGLEDERPFNGATGPQKMSSGLLTINLKCVGASMGEKPPLVKKLPATTTVGKLKILCETFFKLKSVELKLFLQEEGSPLPTLLDNEMESLLDVGIGNDSTILVDEES
ncbi:tubulin-folding cofactor E isoform X2 [Amaranthus tricolor]|uniref:tubulin-folding cofactor E isoform X2 n=1 Tax=Amaranthus tricolor TaxID=29722 RepID=UPI002582FD64|nr:tubulin-folding cofactor E isoform X2 [Amaranthus tricolor]